MFTYYFIFLKGVRSHLLHPYLFVNMKVLEKQLFFLGLVAVRVLVISLKLLLMT